MRARLAAPAAALLLLLVSAPLAAADPVQTAAPLHVVAQATDSAAATDDYDPLFDDPIEPEVDTSDPLEPLNRAFFGVNQWLDRLIWDPVTRAYQFVMPEPGRRAVRRAFRNLNAPPIFVNDLLQLRFRDAGETLGRFVLNSTLGMAGLFDVGVEAGWHHHSSDFGQTLARYGVHSGPYLVLPVLGPTTLRDGFGDAVDLMFDPLTYVFGIGLLGPLIKVSIGTGTGIATREHYYDELKALEESSVDFYAALRSVYLQRREAQIWSEHVPPPTATNGGP